MRLSLSFTMGALLAGATAVGAQGPVPQARAGYVAQADGGVVPAARQVQVVPAQGAPVQAAPLAPAPGPLAPPPGGLAPANAMVLEGMPGQASTFYFDAEYLLWSLREVPFPTLPIRVPVTLPINTFDQTLSLGQGPVLPGGVRGPLPAQDPANLIVRNINGIVNVRPTPVVPALGSDDLTRNGARLTLGFYVAPDVSIEASYFQLERHTFNNFQAAGQDIFTINTGFNNTFLIPQTTVVGGVAQTTFVTNTEPVVVQTQVNTTASGFYRSELLGADINCKTRALVIGNLAVNFRAGFRYLNLNEDFGVDGNVLLSAPPVVLNPPDANGNRLPSNPSGAPTVPVGFTFSDTLSASNHFYGGQVGTSVEYALGNFLINGGVKVAVGGNQEEVKFVELTSAAPVGALPGNGLILPAQNGTQSRTQLAYLCECNLAVAYQVAPYMRLFSSYNWLYLNRAIRAGNAYGTTSTNIGFTFLDQNFNSTTSRSAAVLNDDKFFAHGISFGVEFAY